MGQVKEGGAPAEASDGKKRVRGCSFGFRQYCKDAFKQVKLEDHVRSTYANIRIGFAVASILLPVILLFVGLLYHVPIQCSMNAYYHAGNGAARNEFVGILIAVGCFLYFYKGYTIRENIALNLAGGFLVLVALVPMPWDGGDSCGQLTLQGVSQFLNSLSAHNVFASLFFVSVAYVCTFRAKDTLTLIKNDQFRRGLYEKIYIGIGIVLFFSPVAAFLATLLYPGRFVFAIEALFVWIFGSYWIVKTCEINQTEVEESALKGKLEVVDKRNNFFVGESNIETLVPPASEPRQAVISS